MSVRQSFLSVVNVSNDNIHSAENNCIALRVDVQTLPHTMYYIWLLMIVTSCAAAQRCADSSNKNTYTRTTYRVSDEDFNSLFTDAGVTTSSIYCLTLCATYQTNTYYETTTRRCSCQGVCASYSQECTHQYIINSNWHELC